jgi:hypothetical protein
MGGKISTPLMPMRSTLLFALLLSIAAASAFGETRYEISTRLSGYDLIQGTKDGKSSDPTDLPRIPVRSGSEGLIDFSKKIKFPTGGNAVNIPGVGGYSFQHFRTDFVGIRIRIYVRQAEEEGKLTFLLRAEICQRDIPSEQNSPLARTTSSVRGIANVGTPKIITIGAPGGKKPTLEITFTAR